MIKKASIAGSGISGLLLAWKLAKTGWQVSIIEASGKPCCSLAAGGMITPWAELEYCEPIIKDLGKNSLRLWPELDFSITDSRAFSANGSLILAHPQDKKIWDDLRGKILYRDPSAPIKIWGTQEITQHEPTLGARFESAIYIEEEGHLDVLLFMAALRTHLKTMGCNFSKGLVKKVAPQKIYLEEGSIKTDLAVDCRGLGQSDKKIRGVRGEALLIHAPEMTLNRPIRIAHPQFPLYIIPRADNYFYIGATSIESEDDSPISVRSCLELLSACWAVHPKFAEARIVDQITGLRPATDDHTPFIHAESGYLAIGGLYRHGYLLAPTLVELAMLQISGRPIPDRWASLINRDDEKKL